MLADVPRELEGVAGVVGELHHLVALVVVTENDDAAAELRPGGGDARVHLLIRQTEVLLGQRLALADVILFVFGQDVKLHFVSEPRSFVKLFAKPITSITGSGSGLRARGSRVQTQSLSRLSLEP